MFEQDFQDKYNVVKKLGSGGYSEVFLVTDFEGNEYALKKIDKKGNTFSRELLFREINIMQTLQQRQKRELSGRKSSEDLSTSESSLIFSGSKFVAQIYDWEQTEEDVKILLQYCNGGDLRRELANFRPNFVFPVNEARKIIADILKGLQFIHGHGFVHRDIKLENILVKTDPNYKRKMYKIGDFGISKDVSTGHTRTVLGTRQYMSPQLLAGRAYRFQVDMWALGVLFYLMLNMAYPFQLNPMIDDCKLLSNQLVKDSRKFSYKQSINRCKNIRKQPSTCTKDMQNLFLRIFESNVEKRLTFIEIREHPVFAQFFKKGEKSFIKQIYKENYIKKSGDQPSPGGDILFRVFKETPTIVQFNRQYKTILNKNSEIEILMQMHYEVKRMDALNELQKLSLAYNLLKFYLIRKQRFLRAIQSREICQYFNSLNMKDFSVTDTYNKLIDRIGQLIPSAQSRIIDLQSLCFQNIEEIMKTNEYFYENLQQDVKVSEFYKLNFDGPFKLSYRLSTSRAYQILKKQYDREPSQKNIYLITMILICHFFNRIFGNLDLIKYIFGDILALKDVQAQHLDFQKLRVWLYEAPQNVLYEVSDKISKKFNA